MKALVKATGTDLETKVDSKFGRCPHFNLVDPYTNEYEALENPDVQAMSGAGMNFAPFVANVSSRKFYNFETAIRGFGEKDMLFPRGNSPGKTVGAYGHTPLRAPWPGRRIAPLSPLKGAYPLQTTTDGSEFLRNSEMSSLHSFLRTMVQR